MRHQGTVCLAGPRLALRPFVADDAEAMFSAWAGRREAMEQLNERPQSSWAETAEILYVWQQQYQEDPAFYQWAVTERQSGVLCGRISLFLPFRPRPGRWRRSPFGSSDPPWEVGFCFGPDFWGRGYSREALQIICRFWFGPVGAQGLAACCRTGNRAADRVLQTAGFWSDHDTLDAPPGLVPAPCRLYGLTKEVRNNE